MFSPQIYFPLESNGSIASTQDRLKQLVSINDLGK